MVDANSAELLMGEQLVLKATVVPAAAFPFTVEGAQVLTGGAHAEGPPRALFQDLVQDRAQSLGQCRALGGGQGPGSADELAEGIGAEGAARRVGEIQAKAALIMLRGQAQQIAFPHQGADGLRRCSASGAVVLGEGADGPGKAVGAFEITQRRPLGRIQAGGESFRTGTAAQLLYQLGYCLLGGGGPVQHARIVASRNYTFNHKRLDSLVPGPMYGTCHFSGGPKAFTFQAAGTSLTAVSQIPRDQGETRGGSALSNLMYSG